MLREGRTWSFNASRTAWLANAFAKGLRSRAVLPAIKHFPGLGEATRNTDELVVRISASRTALAPGLRPYRMAVANGLPLVMLSNATYPAWDRINAAGWSPAVVTGLLRNQLGFRGVTMTDSLDGTARARSTSPNHLAVLAALAGTDLILTTGSEASTRSVFVSLVARAKAGSIPLAPLRASHARILSLKALLQDPAPAGVP